MIALVSFLGRLLGLDIIYDWQYATCIAPHTAAGLLLLTLGLAQLCYRLVAAAVWILRWQIAPLISKVVAARSRANDSAMHLTAIMNTAADGIITVNRIGTLLSGKSRLPAPARCRLARTGRRAAHPAAARAGVAGR